MKQTLHILKPQNILLLGFMLSGSIATWAQATISGKVIDDKGKAVAGASVYIDSSLDGATADTAGNFTFSTTETGAKTIVASDIGHENGGLPLDIKGDIKGLVIKLRTEKTHKLNDVVITAGSFDASNDKDKTVLKPLDIVTTAGTQADVVKSMETLPGTQKQGAENGLFVRGGDASEAAILVDGMVVQNAFFSGPPGVTTRSRFGAFQYKGVSFSSGGYSARYGQALSSVLELNSLDLADKSTVNLGINMAGVYASGTKLWKNSSLDVGANYNNLSPFYGIANTNFKFYDVPVGGGGNLRYAWKPNKDGIFKVTVNGSYISSGIALPNPASPDSNLNYETKNTDIFSEISFRQVFKNKFSLYTAASYSYDNNDNSWGGFPYKETDQRAQYRIEGKWYATSRFSLLAGTEMQHYNIQRNAYLPTAYNVDSSYKKVDQDFTETQVAGFLEADYTPVYWLAIRPGIRYEHSELLKQGGFAPRMSLAIKTSDNSQVSLAYGIFYQNADNNYLLYGYRPNFQQAVHYIANWQLNKNDRTLRIEGYYKTYNDLVREIADSGAFDPNPYHSLAGLNVNNSGYGYATGAELFWRDKKSIKNFDYWISYSYIDTRRLYRNYVSEVTPDFIANHNLSLVAKYFIDKWQTNISATYSYASGRPSYDMNWNSVTTPDYNNLALTVSYLHTFGKWFTVFYLGIDNITNAHNVFGYRYDINNNRTPILPPLYRSIFFGVNMSLTQFSKDEL
ncbi:MAG: TonB-dependent receptor [Flavipsychrobacter sp.]